MTSNRKTDCGKKDEKRTFAIVLGQVLQSLRLSKKMSLIEVARLAKISEATICRYEHGSRIDVPLSQMKLSDVEKVVGKIRVPDLYTAYKLSLVLGSTLNDLVAKCIEIIEEAKKEAASWPETK